MRKAFCLAMALAMAAVLATSCQKESRYAYREEGIQELNGGDYESAIRSFDQALENSKGLVGKFELDVLKYRAEAEFRVADYKAAAHTYDILVQVDKESPEYLYMRARAKAEAGDEAGGLDDYTRAVVLGKESGLREPALLAVGAALEGKGKTKEAMALYAQAQSDGIKNGELYNRMGLCKIKEKDYDQALAYFNQGIQAGDGKAMAQLKYNQAVAYEYKLDFKKALELLEQYQSQYGPDKDAEREIAFLKTR